MLAEENKNSGRSALDGEFSRIRPHLTYFTAISCHQVLHDGCRTFDLYGNMSNLVPVNLFTTSEWLCKLQVTIATILMLDLILLIQSHRGY